MSEVSDLFEQAIEAAANRDAKIAQLDEEYTRRVAEVIEEKRKLNDQLDEVDQRLGRIHQVRADLLAKLRGEARVVPADEPPF